MIDIHTHILPNVDDGSTSFENSLAMLKEAKAQGVTHIILTPHSILNTSYYLEKDELKKRFDDFVSKVEDIGIKVFLGSEIYYTEKTFHKLINNELTTFNNSKYCIVEFPMHEETDIDEAMYNVKVKGFQPILAHPERYKFLDVNGIRTIKEHALIQVNTSSILGLHGKKAKKIAFELMKNDLVDYISSDCHNVSDRNVNLLETYNIVSKKFGKQYADKVFVNNQKRLIQEIEK